MFLRLFFRAFVIVMLLLIYAEHADAQRRTVIAERVIMAGLNNQMGSEWGAFIPDDCIYVKEQRRRSVEYPQTRPPDPLIWNIQGVRLATMFRAKVGCIGRDPEVRVWSDWSYWVYAGPTRDITGDGVMDDDDVAAFNTAWASREGDPEYGEGEADLDGNGGVGMADMALMRATKGLTLVGNRWVKVVVVEE